MELGLRGRKALMTGTLRGIGRACSEVLAGEGCDVVLVSRTAARGLSAPPRPRSPQPSCTSSFAMAKSTLSKTTPSHQLLYKEHDLTWIRRWYDLRQCYETYVALLDCSAWKSASSF
jgi:NAD(P)-dependent dehydrogenase (short-subunit alcohol dehydrogenase family)